GTTHVKDIKEISADFKEGEKLSFLREDDNPHDENAIIVKNKDGRKIGYVPMKNNEILARLMDAGKLVYGVFKEKELAGNWLKINMQVFLDD
ncbi:MAG: HIRAN domain-containing protein, partial [Deltaproteobacteria bacterium]|nr:HIRAN domain-containing protein [Deltaproteobacteria bacterium]